MNAGSSVAHSALKNPAMAKIPGPGSDPRRSEERVRGEERAIRGNCVIVQRLIEGEELRTEAGSESNSDGLSGCRHGHAPRIQEQEDSERENIE